MAKKYNNFRVGGSPKTVGSDYSVWTNSLLERVIINKLLLTGKSTKGHKLIDSDVVYILPMAEGLWRLSNI